MLEMETYNNFTNYKHLQEYKSQSNSDLNKTRGHVCSVLCFVHLKLMKWNPYL